jgi:hypothetical protein
VLPRRARTLNDMFARYFVELPLEAGEIERALTLGPDGWVPGLAEKANARGDALLAEVGFGDDVRVARQVQIEFGQPVRVASKLVLPLRWTATGASGLFPALDADLEVAPLGPDRTQLAMSARYEPPFGPIGRAIDRALLFRVAEATLKDFLDRVATALVEGPEHGSTHGPSVPTDAVATSD